MVVQLGLVAVQAAMSSKDPATVERVSALLGAGAVFLATWEIPPPSAKVEKVIPDERFTR